MRLIVAKVMMKNSAMNTRKIAGPASTRKECEQDIMEQEASYYTALESARVWIIRGLNLELRDEAGALQVQFVRSDG